MTENMCSRVPIWCDAHGTYVRYWQSILRWSRISDTNNALCSLDVDSMCFLLLTSTKLWLTNAHFVHVAQISREDVGRMRHIEVGDNI